MNKKRKLMLATPMYGSVCTLSFTESLLSLYGECMQSSVQLTCAFIGNESLIQRARNTLANIFMQETECDFLMFIDSDIGFNGKDVIQMMDMNKDILCGAYTKKEINWNSVHSAAINGVPPDGLIAYSGSLAMNTEDYKNNVSANSNDLIEVRHSGTGFMMIRRNVIQDMSKTAPRYLKPHVIVGESVDKIENCHMSYFDCSIDSTSNVFLSEDYHFCKVARELGYKVYVAPWIQLKHTGAYTFEGGLYPVINKKQSS